MRSRFVTTMRATKSLLGLKTDPPIQMVSARVIADAHGPFAQTRLADAGVERAFASATR